MVFTPTYRRGPFTDEIPPRREAVMRAVCADFQTELVAFNGEKDYVHLLGHYPPKAVLSRLVGSLKGVSARRLRQEFPAHIRTYLWGEHFWPPATSRHPAADHPWPSSRSTSRTRSDQTDRYYQGADNSGASRLRIKDAIPPEPETQYCWHR